MSSLFIEQSLLPCRPHLPLFGYASCKTTVWIVRASQKLMVGVLVGLDKQFARGNAIRTENISLGIFDKFCHSYSFVMVILCFFLSRVVRRLSLWKVSFTTFPLVDTFILWTREQSQQARYKSCPLITEIVSPSTICILLSAGCLLIGMNGILSSSPPLGCLRTFQVHSTDGLPDQVTRRGLKRAVHRSFPDIFTARPSGLAGCGFRRRPYHSSPSPEGEGRRREIT